MRASRFKTTEWYDYLNVNPKGRISGDCVVRAIAAVVGKPWETVVREMTELGIKKALVLNDPSLFPLYLESQGFRLRKEPTNPDGTKMSIKRFLELNPSVTTFVAKAGTHHVTCVIDRKVRDIWDCSDETMHRWWSR